MAIALQGTFVSPSMDKRTNTQLNSTSIESGLYYNEESRTITCGRVSVTSNKWSVICISTEQRNTLHCYTQIWIPVQSSVGENVTMFVRYSAAGTTTYGNFRAILNDKQAVQTSANGDVRLVISNTQPTAISGVTQVWIDTSS